jgi:hypothetical protein
VEASQKGAQVIAMSLFDYIKSEYKLPIPQEVLEDLSNTDWEEVEFQTKSLDSGGTLDNYEISIDGSIYIETFKVKEGGGLLDKVRTGIEKIDYTGELIFYTDLLSKDWDYWIEFKALFYKGELKEIELNELEKNDPAERLKMEKMIKKNFSEFLEQRNSWWYKVFYVVTLPLRLLLAIIKFILSSLVGLTMRIERWLS